MANSKHLEILKKGVEEWNCWRKANSELDIDLSAADLTEVNFSELDLQCVEIDFTSVNFSGAHLSGVRVPWGNFQNANLSNCELESSELFCCSFQSANLSGADLKNAVLNVSHFRNANLSQVELSWAEIHNGDFSNSSLVGADFEFSRFNGCDFSKAKMRDCNFGFTTFGGCDFSGAVGLETGRYEMPNVVDPVTLEKSGMLDLYFLRSCGLSDKFIEYIPMIFGSGADFFSVFISYSTLDSKFADKLFDALQSRGIRCWLDKHEILLGDKIHAKIDEGILAWDKVLLCCSENSLKEGASWWVEEEIERVFRKERVLRKERGKDVMSLIPLNLDGFVFSDQCTNHFTADIQARNAADFRDWENDHDKFEAELEKVIRSLRADAGAKLPPPTSKL